MKYLLIIILLTTGFDAMSQRITYDSVLNVPGTTQELLSRAKKWIVQKYPESTLHLTDSTGIVVKGYIPAYETMFSYNVVKFTMILDFKENKYRYQLLDFTQTYNVLNRNFMETGATATRSLDPVKNPLNRKFVRHIDSNLKDTINSLISYMNKETKETKETW